MGYTPIQIYQAWTKCYITRRADTLKLQELSKSAIKAVVGNGVDYITAEVKKLLMTDGLCTGVRTEDSRTFTASKLILFHWGIHL